MSYAPLTIPEKNLYILVGDQRHGPFSMEELRRKFTKGEILRGTYLWYPGLENWITIGDVPEFDRRDAPAPTSIPGGPSEQNQFWIYDQNKVVAIVAEALRESIRANKFRRADLVFDEGHNKWMRADQHPELGRFFRPAVPPPPSGEVIMAAQSVPPVLQTESEKIPDRAVAPRPIPVTRPEATKAKSLTWIWTGVGLASVGLVLALGRTFWMPVDPESSRAPASVTPAPVVPSRLTLLLPLGIGFDSIKGYKHYLRCRLKNEHPNAGVTYRCSFLPGTLETTEFTLRNGKLARVTAWFSKQSGGAELGELTSEFGAPELNESVKCNRLTESQRVLYRAYCAKNLLAWTSWTDGNVRAVALYASENGRPTPLEIWVETVSK